MLSVGGGYRPSDGASDGNGDRGEDRRCGRCSEGLSYRRNKRYSNRGRRSERLNNGGSNRLRRGINGGLRHCRDGCERRHGTTATVKRQTRKLVTGTYPGVTVDEAGG